MLIDNPQPLPTPDPWAEALYDILVKDLRAAHAIQFLRPMGATPVAVEAEMAVIVDSDEDEEGRYQAPWRRFLALPDDA